MAQSKFVTWLMGGRCYKATATSALALSAVAGGFIISSGNALAFQIDFNTGSLANGSYGLQWNPPTDPAPPYAPPYVGGLPNLLANPGPVTPAIATPFTKQWYDTDFQYTKVGDVTATNYFFPTDKQIWFVDSNTLLPIPNPVTSGNGGPSKGSGNIEWDWKDVSANGDWRIPPDPHSFDQWQVDVDFNPNLTLPQGSPSVFDYVIRISDRSGAYPGIVPAPREGNKWFEDVILTSAIVPSPGGGSVIKEIYTAVYNSVLGDYQPGTLIGTLTNSGTLPLVPGYDILYIRDTVTPNVGGTIDAYQNTYRQTPGPLPIVGAGAAFGFSRKLRGRIKASRTA